MEFETVLNDIYAIKAEFSENVSDEFGASILASEMEDMAIIGTKLHETQVDIYGAISEVDSGLEKIKTMVPIC